MAVKWSWAWGPETAAVMLSDMGFTPSDTTASRIDTSNAAADIYSYTGSPSRYSLRLDPNQSVIMPAGTCPLSGWLACPFKMDDAGALFGGLSATVGQLWVGEAGTGTYISMASSGGGVVNSAIKLYIANVHVATSATVFAWNATWNYVALKFDCTANPWTASVWVNGVEAITVQTQAQAAATTLNTKVVGGANADRDWKVGQVIIHTLPGLNQEKARFCTRIEPVTPDGTEVGTWTQSVGTDNFAVVDGPFDVATYTTRASAASGDAFTCTTGVLSTSLGISPTAIDGITAHDWSTGGGITVFAAVGNAAAAFTNGAAVTPLVSTTYCFATSIQNPSGGDWLAAQTAHVKHQVT